jgi:peptidoglycan-N-acetylglucosamine deacetylase
MLNARNTSRIFIIVLAAGLVARFLIPVPVAFYIILAGCYLLVLIAGSYFIRAGFFLKSVCRGSTSQPEIAISFDDGPSSAFSNTVLDILKKNEVPAAFFCIGKHVAGNEVILKRIDEEGHLIGNHSFSHHFFFDLFSSKKMLEDMRSMDQLVKTVTGRRPRLFRPPYGVTNPNLAKAVRNGGYTSVGWTVRSLDTVKKDPARLLQNLLHSLAPGRIILFHDTSETTAGMLESFIEQVKSKGYGFSRLDKMCKLEPYV